MDTRCPHCGQMFEVDFCYSGRELQCTECNQMFIVVNIAASLATCSVCGGMVSKTAPLCPHCGEITPHKIAGKPINWFSATVGALVILGLIMLAVWFFEYSEYAQEAAKAKRTQVANSGGMSNITAWVMAQDFVSSELVSPGTAKFPFDPADRTVRDLRNGRYTVSSYVDSQNALGATMRTRFKITVEDAGGDMWKKVGEVMFY